MKTQNCIICKVSPLDALQNVHHVTIINSNKSTRIIQMDWQEAPFNILVSPCI